MGIEEASGVTLTERYRCYRPTVASERYSEHTLCMYVVAPHYAFAFYVFILEFTRLRPWCTRLRPWCDRARDRVSLSLTRTCVHPPMLSWLHAKQLHLIVFLLSLVS